MIKKTKRKKVIHCNLSEVYTSVAFNPDIVVIVHAPKSCSHIIYNAWLNSKRKMLLNYNGQVPDVEDNLFITGMTDKEAIFGGEKLLENCIANVVQYKNPKCIIVASGCAAAVIGDDVQSVCDKAEVKYNLPIIFIPGSGFMSDQTKDGSLLTTSYLYKKFIKNNQPIKDEQSVVVLGLNRLQLLQWELLELKRIYGYFGYTNLLLPPSGLSVEELTNISKASLIGTYAPTVEKLKEYNKFSNMLSKELSIPTINNRIPLSIKETYEYINTMGVLLDKEDVAESAIINEQNLLNSNLEKYKSIFQGERCTIALGHPLRFIQIDELIFILRSVGFHIKGLVLLNDLTDSELNEYKNYLEKSDCGLQISQENEWNYTEDDDIFITSIFNEKFKRQFCFRRKRIGIGGIKVFLERLSIITTNNRSLGHE